MPQGRSNDPREFVQWKQHCVLLIDGSTRRDERASSLRQAGIEVHCASDGTAAAALWEPEKYQLVLFEFSAAEIDVRPFCEKLMLVWPRQKIGMYCAEPPFIVPARRTRFTSPTAANVEPAGSIPDPLQDASAAAAERIAPDTHALLPAPVSIAAQQPIRDRRQRPIAVVARHKNGHNGLAQAAQEIAALRWRNSKHVAPVAPVRPAPERVKPESHATIAARVLGGEQ